MDQQKPAVRLAYLYNYCNDVEAARRFYVELLGMKQLGYHNDKDLGWLNIDAGGLEFMYFRTDKPLPKLAYASQPGGGEGQGLHTSWSVQLGEVDFAAAWRRLVEAKTPAEAPLPDWRQDSYWGFTVMDPAGNTVEVFCTPKTRPASTTWAETQ